VRPTASPTLASKEHALKVWNSIAQAAHWEDLILLAVVGWLTVPTLYLPYEAVRDRPFSQSNLHFIADHLQQISRIALLIYCVDLLKMFSIGCGLHFVKMEEFPHAFAQITYTVWVANRLKAFKKYVLNKYVSRHPETFGRVQIVNRLLNAALYALTGLVVLNILKVEMGIALQSFVALGGVGTVAIGLASQGITTQILNGLMLASSDRLYEGDHVRFGNGLSGTITKLGWMETVLRGSDEITVSVPNTDLVKQQISNLSRVRYSQVKQTLRFKYKESSKLPDVLQSIKEEIRISCPELITDGSRPFRAHWTSFGPNYLEVEVVAHFRIRPIGEDYWNNRQRVLQAIDRAVKICQVEYA